MLRNTSAIDGYFIVASDGHLGTVSDFLFDDVSWLVRWLIVDTGNWLSGCLPSRWGISMPSAANLRFD